MRFRKYLHEMILAACLMGSIALPVMAQNAATKPTLANNKASDKNFIYVSGVVKDAVTRKPIVAANLSIPDFSAAISDENGKFKIKVQSLQATLTVMADGYQTKLMALKGMSNVEVFLIDDKAFSYNDYAQLTFSNQSQSTISNAVGSTTVDGSWKRPMETPESILQGKLAGVHVQMRSGTPFVGGFIQVRGANSLYTTNQPLIVVDGMIFDYTDYGSSILANHYTNALATIDAKDIDNITVIKDGVSTYGTKGANGVILITTNHASKLATKIDFGAYTGVNFRPKKLPLLDAAGYRTYLTDVLSTSGMSYQQIQAHPAIDDNTSNPLYYNYHNNTDWQDVALENSVNNNFYLKVTGGDNIAKYALNLGYMKTGGITSGTDVNRYNVRFNADLNLSRRLTASANLSYTYYEQRLKNQGLAYKTNPIYLSLIKAPILSTNVIDAAGVVSPNLAPRDTFGVSNPAAIIENMIGNTKVYRFFGSINLKYKLGKDYTLNTIAGITSDKVREQSFIPSKGVATDTLFNGIATSRMAGQTKRIFALYSDSYIEYLKTYKNKHQVAARAGFRYQNSKTEQDVVYGFNSSTDDFISVGTGVASLRRVGGSLGENAWVNAYFSTDYSFLSKYFITFNITADGSSRFGKQAMQGIRIGENKFAVLPSIAGAWLISSESFMKQFKFVDIFKLRASYANTGNDDIGDYTAQGTYVSQNLLGVQGLVRGNLANPYLQWEKNSKWNVGLDLSFFKERINITVDVFQNKTTNMISYVPLAAASGYNYAISNDGSMTTKGIEYAVNARVIDHKSLKWDLGFTVNAFTNRINTLPNDNSIYTFGNASIISQVGSPIGLFYGYKTNGVYASDAAAAADGFTKRQYDASYASFKGGDVRFVDLNGDKIIDEKDRQVIGNPNPDFTGGISTKLSYKAFTLEAVATFSKGNQAYNGIRAILESQSSASNQLQSVVNRWRAPGQITNMPKATWGDPMGNNSFSDRWIEDASFFRLKTLSLSYDLLTNGKKTVKNVTLYAIGNNLFTFTKYLGFDPEYLAAESSLARGVDVGLEPQFKSLTFGVKVGL